MTQLETEFIETSKKLANQLILVEKQQRTIEELKQWKKDASKIWLPVIEFVTENSDKLGVTVGDSVSKTVLEILKEKWTLHTVQFWFCEMNKYITISEAEFIELENKASDNERKIRSATEDYRSRLDHAIQAKLKQLEQYRMEAVIEKISYQNEVETMKKRKVYYNVCAVLTIIEWVGIIIWLLV